MKRAISIFLMVLWLGLLTSYCHAEILTPEQWAQEQELRARYPGYSQVQEDGTIEPGDNYAHAGEESLEKWRDWKYGLRIHWGVYSVIGVDASVSLCNSSKEYQQHYHTLYEVFNPTDFDPDEWMKMMKRGGMKYFTFTTKHADGFCMWPTKVLQKGQQGHWSRKRNSYRRGSWDFTDVENTYSIAETPYQKDIVGMLVKSAKKHKLGIGLYYNHFNWHDPDAAWMECNFYYDPDYTEQSDPIRWRRFIEKERQQLTEILTWYGDVDLLSLDMYWPDAAQKDAYDVARLCRKLQPHIMIRHRGIGPYGDYQTPERWVPDGKENVGVGKPWQVIDHCGTGFAWQRNDSYKPASWILGTLIDVVAKGGNFQVAFGPMANGKWDPEQIERINYVGDWLKVNGDAIYKTRIWTPFYEGEHIRFTRSKDWKYVYAICLEWPGEELKLTKVKAKPDAKIIMLGYKNLLGMPNTLKWRQDEQGLILEIPEKLQSENKRPCKQAWVFRIEAVKPKIQPASAVWSKEPEQR